MNRVVQFLIFFGIFFVIYFGLHFYVFRRMSTLLTINRTLWFYAIMVILALSFPAASMLDRFHESGASRALYIASGVWLGALFLIFSSLLIFEILKLAIKLDHKAAGVTILIVVASLVIYGVINNMTIKVKEIEVPIPNLEKEVTIVQLSDMHIGAVHEWNYMNKLVEKTNKLNPDIVMITGDLYDGSRKVNDKIVEPLNNIRAKTFFVTGNHEMFQGVDDVMNMLKKTKVQPLRNEIVEYEGIQIVGIDNPSRELSQTNEVINTMKIDKTKPSILMFHPPIGLEQANQAGINLQISGHTHNGQIFPFTLLSMIVYPRNKGMFNHNGTYMYVTQGAGTWGPPMRIGTRNEIVVIKLIKS